jgi:hypothetical protein
MRRLALFLALLLLAACETTPPPPLLSPITATGDYGFGYTERQLGPEDWEVTYVGPVRPGPVYAGANDAMRVAARTQSFDFMLWRAAQIAQSEGFAAFRVGQTRSNIDTRIEDYYDPFYGPGWGRWGPWGVNRFYYPYPYTRSISAYLQAQTSADIHLLRAAAPGDYVAQDVIAQARRNYPNAEPAAPPDAQPPPAQ